MVQRERTVCKRLYQANKGSEKGKKGKKDKKGLRKNTRTKDTDNKKRGACNNCNVVGHVALNCPRTKKRESHTMQAAAVEVICTA